jgi:MFS family permease
MALAAFGAGSMLVALALPKLLERLPERRVMLSGASLIALGLFAGVAAPSSYVVLLTLWFVMGVGYSLAQTPSGRLLRRSAREEDRPAVFAAQFALSHACWLLTYPLAGWLGAKAGMTTSFLTLAAVAALAIVVATRVWPAIEEADLPHAHEDLAVDDPHLKSNANGAGNRHSHTYVVDDQHPRWPS